MTLSLACANVWLARALYQRPKLVVLDEPNSNLDTQGELALNNAIQTLKGAGSTVIIVVTERSNELSRHVMVVVSGEVVDNGHVMRFGTPAEPAGGQKGRR